MHGPHAVIGGAPHDATVPEDVPGRENDGDQETESPDDFGSLETMKPADDLAMAETGAPPSLGAGVVRATGSALDATALADSGTDAGVPVAAPQLLAIPKNHYKRERELARGGMGRIIQAEDLRLGRPVAIKELLQSSAAARARFEREAMITARLQHPAIVPLYEAGCWPDGEPFFAMKMVAGSPLDEVVRECKTQQERFALLPRVIDVADALAYAHSRGVIHRDLKPANVLVGDFGETVVIDWGLAKLVGVAIEESEDEIEDDSAVDPVKPTSAVDLTVVGQAMGTPAYMPPEQARGEEVDKRADVYALGAILYHLLSGQMAYAKSNSAAEILSKVLAGPPDPLDTIAEGIPSDLLTIVNKAMARTVEDRFEDAEEFAEELRRFQSGQLVAAHDYSTFALVRRWIQRHRAMVMSGALMLALLTAFAVWSFVSVRSERDLAMQARSEALHAQTRADHERQDAVAKSHELALNLASSLTGEQPLAALDELAQLEGLETSEALVERAREIASQAYGNRIPTELTSAGSDHGVIALSPDDRQVGMAWHGTQVAILSLLDKSVRVLSGPEFDTINNIRFSPGGRWVAASSLHTKSVLLWDTQVWGEPTVIEARRGARQIEFSPDDHYLAVRGAGVVAIDLHSDPGDASNRAKVPTFYANDMSFSPDSSTLAIASDSALLYDLATGAVTNLMPGKVDKTPVGRATFSKVLFSPTGKAVAFADERVFIAELPTGKPRELFAATGKATALAFSSDGQTLAAGAKDKIIYLYQLGAKSSALHTLTGHQDMLTWLSFAGDMSTLVSAGHGGQLRLWHLGWQQGVDILWSTSAEVLSPSLGAQEPVLSGDGNKILAYDRTNVLSVWDRQRPGLVEVGKETWGSRALFSIAGDLMAWTGGGLDHSVHVANAEGMSRDVGDHGEQVEILSLSPDGRYIASGGSDKLVLWDLATQQSTALVGHEADLRLAAFAGDTLISADFRGNVFAWSLPGGEGHKVSEHGGILNGMVGACVDPEGPWIATGGIDKQVVLHDLVHGSKRVLATADAPVRGMASTPAGDKLAVSLKKGEITVFSPHGDEEPVVLASPDSMESLLFPVFSPDGRALATSNGVTGLRVWPDWRNGSETRLLLSRAEALFPAFSADGKRLVAPGEPQGLASVWHVETGQRRDLQGLLDTGRAAFWPKLDRVVVSTSGSGLIYLWQDDLPRDWPSLRTWIADTLEEHRGLATPEPEAASGPKSAREP